jgi:hypothetical protein
LERLISSLDKLGQSQGTLHFKADYNRETQGYQLRASNPPARCLSLALQSWQRLEQEMGIVPMGHPTLVLFERILAEHSLSIPDKTRESVNAQAGQCRQLASAFQAAYLSKAHRATLRRLREATAKNQRGLKAYIDALLECHSRLLVVRVDLAYGNADKYHITADETLAHRDVLLETLHRKTLPWMQSLEGYAWRLEYGAQQQFHYHVLLFFNEAKSWQDITLAKQVGEHWQRHITEGKGTYYNCNQKKETYAKLGIGRIHYLDTDKRAALIEAASYLTKPNSDASPYLLAGTRTFGRGKRLQRIELRGRKRRLKESEECPLPRSVTRTAQ